MMNDTKVKQGTIVCQVCEEIIEVIESTEGVKTLYGICTDCSKEKEV